MGFSSGISLQNINSVAKDLLNHFHARVFLIEGKMGAGKTTLVTELCHVLATKDSIGSPTFSIVNEYSYNGGKIFHFDLYRVKSIDELFDLGIEEYLDSGEYCFVEWPAFAEQLMEDTYIKVDLSVNPDGTRQLSAEQVTPG